MKQERHLFIFELSSIDMGFSLGKVKSNVFGLEAPWMPQSDPANPRLLIASNKFISSRSNQFQDQHIFSKPRLTIL